MKIRVGFAVELDPSTNHKLDALTAAETWSSSIPCAASDDDLSRRMKPMAQMRRLLV